MISEGGVIENGTITSKCIFYPESEKSVSVILKDGKTHDLIKKRSLAESSVVKPRNMVISKVPIGYLNPKEGVLVAKTLTAEIKYDSSTMKIMKHKVFPKGIFLGVRLYYAYAKEKGFPSYLLSKENLEQIFSEEKTFVKLFEGSSPKAYSVLNNRSKVSYLSSESPTEENVDWYKTVYKDNKSYIEDCVMKYAVNTTHGNSYRYVSPNSRSLDFESKKDVDEFIDYFNNKVSKTDKVNTLDSLCSIGQYYRNSALILHYYILHNNAKYGCSIRNVKDSLSDGRSFYTPSLSFEAPKEVFKFTA